MKTEEKPVPTPTPPTRTELDNAIIKRVFKDNDALLLAMRAVMLGLNANDSEKKIVHDAFASDELYAAVSQRFLPQIRKEEPIGNLMEAWKGSDKMIFGYERDTIEQALSYKERGIAMVGQALKLLRNPDGKAPNIAVKIDIKKDPLGIDLLTRNMFISAVEDQLVGLKIVAAQKDLTPEQKKAVAAAESGE